MNTCKFNFPKVLSSAVVTLFLLSSTAAFAMDTGEDLEKGSISRTAPSPKQNNDDQLLDEALEETFSPQSTTVSPDELKLQELQRKAEIARLEREIAENEAATRAANLLRQQQAAPQPDPLGQALLETFRGGRSDARVQRNLDKLGLGGFGSFLGLPPRK